jgi:hypothetical protein
MCSKCHVDSSMVVNARQAAVCRGKGVILRAEASRPTCCVTHYNHCAREQGPLALLMLTQLQML